MNKKENIAERLKTYRVENGYSQQDFADLVGVTTVTILRWENGTSKPSSLAAQKLEEIGFGKVEIGDTKQVSKPRLAINKDSAKLRKDIRAAIRLGNQNYAFSPARYVVNGPEDQLGFYETLYKFQEDNSLRDLDTVKRYARRLSLVDSIPELGITTSQSELEKPKEKAMHWNSNYGSHGWHRYVGRFPPHLVRSLLNAFGASNNDVVCDPFAGSGTTLVEARLLGLDAIGIEICPLSALISRTKSKFPAKRDLLSDVIRSLTDFYNQRWSTFVNSRSIGEITHEEILNRQGNTIPEFQNYERWLTQEALLGVSIVVEFIQTLNGFNSDAVTCALSSKMRSIGNVDVDVVRAEYREKPRKNVDVLKLVQRALRKMNSDIENSLNSHQETIGLPESIKVLETSVLDAHLADESVNYIITSPPYGVESISYLRTHLLSYRCLQPILKRDPYAFDEKIIGSEYIRSKDDKPSTHLAAQYSPTFTRFFQQELAIGEASKHIRRKEMMMNFFDDLVNCTIAFHRWLAPNGRVAFVIGNKKINRQVIPTHEIVCEIFEGVGFDLDFSIGHKLKTNNSNSEVPWQSKIIKDEFVLAFTKRSF